MRNNETPVSYLIDMINKMESHGADLPALMVHINHALQMEVNKQQKYDEMLEMLREMFDEWCETGIGENHLSEYMLKAKQLIKEATELVKEDKL